MILMITIINLVGVSLKETVTELVAAADVRVAIHHLDLVVEETATLLIIRIIDHFDPGIWKGKERRKGRKGSSVRPYICPSIYNQHPSICISPLE